MSKSFDVNAILSRHRIINGRKISMANVIPHDHVVEFDGGTSSNKPPFGVGYGSYQIDDNEIIRCSYGPNQSSNSAEIMTIVYALDDLVSKDISGNYVVTSTALKTQLAADIDVQRCLCQKVNIIDGNINSIIVDMDVYVNSQYSPVTVAANVTDKINEYVTSLTFGGSLYVSKLIDLAMSVDGVYNAVVSSPTSNVTVSNTTVITLTDVVIRTL